jgi:hypothetical protein
MSEADVYAQEQDINRGMVEFRLDRNTFTFSSGLKFIADAPELAEELIKEVFLAYVEAERQRPMQTSAEPLPRNGPVPNDHPENIERPVGARGTVFATAVLAKLIFATPEATPKILVDALKKLNLMPQGLDECDDKIYAYIERMCQKKRELYPDLQISVSIREGLMFLERRDLIWSRLNDYVKNGLEAGHTPQTAKPPYSQQVAATTADVAKRQRAAEIARMIARTQRRGLSS